MDIPISPILSTDCLGQIFSKTTATYKYFWFISIIQLFAKDRNTTISVWDIVIRMVSNAWYPIHYFRLSFGKSDSLFEIVTELQRLTNIPIDAKLEDVVEGIKEKIEERSIKRHLNILTKNVPYRFLRPWIDTSDDIEMMARSQTKENDCLYSLFKGKDDFYIVINAQWCNYLVSQYTILLDFAYWNLTSFLQTRNPNVPSISNKLIRPQVRTSLTKQHRFWDMVIELGGPIDCIYTGNKLCAKSYDLDHFMPWSFVAHDLMWNLVPSDTSINSSKSNKLPNLQVYLPKLASLQQHSIRVMLDANKSCKLLTDYISLGYDLHDLKNMSEEEFRDLYKKTFTPMYQLALNMGFVTWKY